MKKKAILLIFMVCLMSMQTVAYASSHGGSSGSFGDKPDWCESVSVPSYDPNRTQYRVKSEYAELFTSVCGTASDGDYITTAIEYYLSDLGINFENSNVLMFDYYCVDLTGYERHYMYYFYLGDIEFDRNDLFLSVDTNGNGRLYSKSAKSVVQCTIYVGCCDKTAGSNCVFVDKYTNNHTLFYNVNIDKFSVSGDVACYMNVSSLDAIYDGTVQPDNLSDLLPARYGVIEPPQNLKLYEKGLLSADTAKFTWTQTDENYRLWTTEIMIHADVGYKLTVDLFGDFNHTGNLLLKTTTVKTSDLHYNVNFLDLTDECRYVYEPIVIEEYGDWLGTHIQLQDCTVSFRNKYCDGEYTYYSNWVKVYIDGDGNYTTEYEYDDAVNGDKDTDYTHDSPSGNVVPDSQYQGGSITSGSSLDDLSDSISNGFGLVGEGGLFDMFSTVFTFIPAPIWSLILFGLSVLISIALLKAVF